MRRHVLWVAAMILGASCAAPQPEPATLATLEVGTCFSGWDPASAAPEPRQTLVRVVDCAQPHESELIGLTTYLSGFPMPSKIDLDVYPGHGELESSAAIGCGWIFDDYRGTNFNASRWVLSHAVPTAREWQDATRNIVCIASFANGPESGTFRDDHATP